MSLEIRIMNLGDIEAEASFTVLGHAPGTTVKVPTYAFLILGAEKPILVDAGFRTTEIMGRLGMKATQTEEQKLENQLAKHGVKPEDIGHVILTHLHLDHAGLVYKFPEAVAVIQRKEMEAGFSGVMGGQYVYEDMEHMFQRLYKPGSLWLLDGQESGPISVVPGVKCAFAKSHSPGMQFVYVETSKGTAVICSDAIYNIGLQTRHYREIYGNYWPSGNHYWTKRDEMAAVARACNDADFLLASHDYEVEEKYGDRII
ncbi:N-acyl homoserine lactonase family protein [Peribacillus kribbensis]|uniref:N-acyl homoserine lactonase family protein n=1 Tax=Peribacillus kribbensis TaxID=356658 RepID=UPI0004242933|nr:N-acyl homoserine lactonase family protein [Peribacillus kribbensis]